MAGRPDRDGLAGRRGSLDSSKPGRRPYVFPFKCSISPPQINHNMENLTFPACTGHPTPSRGAQDYVKMVEELQKENFSLKLRLYLMNKELSKAGITKNIDLDVLAGLDAQKVKDTMVSEAIKTATANEKKFLEAQSKAEQLESDLNDRQLELQQLEEDLQKVLKTKDEQIKTLTKELKQIQEQFEGQGESYLKAKKIIQLLRAKLYKLSKESDSEKFMEPEFTSSTEQTGHNATFDICSKSDPLDLVDKDHYCSFKKDVEQTQAYAQDLEAALVDSKKRLEEKSSEVALYLKELEQKQEALNALNDEMHLLCKSNDCFASKLQEKENLVKSLSSELDKVRETCRDNELRLHEAEERCNSAERRLAVRRNLSTSFEDKGVFQLGDGTSQLSCTSLEEGTLPTFSEVDCVELKERVLALESQLNNMLNEKSIIMAEYNVLLQHIEKLARFMEKLISECSRLSVSGDDGITIAFLSEAQECVNKAMQLSHTLSQDLSTVERPSISRLTIASLCSSSSHFESTRYSVFSKPSSEVAKEPFSQDETVEGWLSSPGNQNLSSFPVLDEKYGLMKKLDKLEMEVENYKAEIRNYEKLFQIHMKMLPAENVEFLKQKQLFIDSCVQTETVSSSPTDALYRELQVELKTLKEKLQGMSEKCSMYEKEVGYWKNEIETIVSQKQSLEQALGCNKRTIDDIKVKYQKCNALLREEQKKCCELLTVNASLQAHVEELKCIAKDHEDKACQTKTSETQGVEKELIEDLVTTDTKEKLQENTNNCDSFLNNSETSPLPASNDCKQNELNNPEEDDKIFLLKTQVSDLKRELHKTAWKKDLFLVVKTVLIERLSAEIKEKDERIKQLAAEIENYRLVQKQSAELAENRADIVQELQTSLKNYQEEIHQLKTENESKNDMNQQLAHDLENSSHTIEKLASEVKEKDFEIQEVTAKLQKVENQRDEKVSEIQILTFQLQSNFKSVHTLTAELETKDNMIKALTDELQDSETCAKSLENQIAVLEQREKSLRTEKKELLNSISKYSIETKDIRSQLLELQKQVEERNACQQTMDARLCDLQQQLDLKNKKLLYMEKECSELKWVKEECEELCLEKLQLNPSSSDAPSQESMSRGCFLKLHHLLSRLFIAEEVEINSEELCNDLSRRVLTLSKLMENLWLQLKQEHEFGGVLVKTQVFSVMWGIIALLTSEVPHYKLALNQLFSERDDVAPNGTKYSESQLQEKILALEKQIVSHEEDKHSAEVELQEKVVMLEKLIASLGEVKQSEAALKEMVVSLEKQILSLGEDKKSGAALKEKVVSLEKQILVLEEAKHSEMELKDKIDAFEKQVAVMEESLKSERQTNAMFEEQKCSLQKQFMDKEEAIQHLSDAKEVAKAQLHKLADQVSMMKVKQTELEEQMAKLHQQLLEKDSMIANLSNDNECLHSSLNQIQKADQDVLHLENMMTSLKNDLKSKCITIDDMKQKLDASEKLSYQYQQDMREKTDQIHYLEDSLRDYSKRNEQQSQNLELRLKQISNYENELSKLYEHLNHNKCNMDAKDQLIEKYELDMKENIGIMENLQSNYKTKVEEFNLFYSEHQNCKMVDLCSKKHRKSQETTCSVDSRDVASQMDSPDRLSPLKHDFSKLQQQLSEAKTLNVSLRFTITSLEEENASFRKQIGDYNGLVKNLSEEKRICDANITRLQKQLELMEQVKGEFVNKVLFGDSCIRRLNEDKQKLMSQMDDHECRNKELQAILRTTKSELDTAQNTCKKQSTHISELEKEVQKNSLIIKQLETDNGKCADIILQLKATSENNAKCINVQREELKKKTAYLSQLTSKLKETSNLVDQLKKDLGSRGKQIEKLQGDLAAKMGQNEDFDLDLKLKLDFTEDQKSKSNEIVHLKSLLEEKCLTIEQLEEKEAEKLKLIEELRQQVNESSCTCDEVKGKLKTNEKLVGEQAEAVHQLKKIVSEMSFELNDLKSKKPSNTSGCTVRDGGDELSYTVREEVLSKWSNRKWLLQSNLLQLQGKLFKDVPVPSKHQSVLFDHIAALNSKIAPVSVQKDPKYQSACDQPSSKLLAEAEKQRYLLTLQADCDFLKNLRHLMKYFLSPIAKLWLSSQTVGSSGNVEACKSAAAFVKVPRQVEEIYQSILEMWSLNHIKKMDVHAGDGKLSFPFAEIADPTTSVKQLEHVEMFLEGSIHSEPVSPRSNYSSPDLGIESDPNQDPAIHEQAEGGSVCISKDSLDHDHFYAGKEMSAFPTSIHAIASLKDYELIRKEVEECVIGFKSITFRTKDGLKKLGGNASPRKLLEHSTLKAILDSCNHVETCLFEIEKLVNQFWYGPYPCEEDNISGLIRENSKLKQSLTKTLAQLNEKDLTLKELMSKEDAKKRYISKQLVDTKKMLRQSKVILERKLGQR